MLTNCLEYDIFVPVFDPAGSRYAAAVTASIKRQLIEVFGGLTDNVHAQKGAWKVGPVTLKDEVTVWRVVSTLGAEGDRVVAEVKGALEKALDQDVIFVLRRQASYFE